MGRPFLAPAVKGIPLCVCANQAPHGMVSEETQQEGRRPGEVCPGHLREGTAACLQPCARQWLEREARLRGSEWGTGCV